MIRAKMSRVNADVPPQPRRWQSATTTKICRRRRAQQLKLESESVSRKSDRLIFEGFKHNILLERINWLLDFADFFLPPILIKTELF